MKKKAKRVISLLVCLAVLFGFNPTAFAAVSYTHDSASSSDNYYKVISKKNWDIAPGIEESEIVLNNDLGTRRQVAHVMVADTTNEYVKVTTSYTNMDTSVYATSTMSQQAAAAESVNGWNVVGAMNTCLSWYDGYPSDQKNQPLGFMMIDGETLWDLTEMYGSLGFPTCVVINSDDRPDGMAKVEMKSITSTSDLTGYEEQVIPCSSGYIVKDGVNQYSSSGAHSADNNNSAPRSVVGVTADGKVVIMENDGRQTISAGMGMYECAEMMLDLGCVYACNCDGGGSSTFISQRPGQELTLVNSPSDGSERETTSGILFVSTVPADGQFAKAHISTEDKYYTPESTVTFDAIGTDLSGNSVDIPEDVTWQIAEEGMGTIEDGVFTSNGTTGTVTAQMVYQGNVVGEASIEIVIPEISFSTSNFVVKYGTTAELSVSATTNEGRNDVVLKQGDYEITCDNVDIGTIDGDKFTAVEEADAPENKGGTLTVTLKYGDNVKGTASITICQEISETLYDFEDGLSGWNVWEIGKDTYAQRGDEYYVEAATTSDGEVHDGDGSMKLYTNQLTAKIFDGSKDYYQLCLYPETSTVLSNVQSYGVWVYIDDEMYAHEFNLRYFIDSNNDGVYDTVKSVTPYTSLTAYEKQEESGWVYLKVDVGGKNILIPGADIESRTDIAASLRTVPNYCRTIQILAYPHTSNAILRTGTVNGKYNVYFDSFTVDYANDVADRTAPEFGTITLLSQSGGSDKELVYGRTAKDSTFNPLSVATTDDNVLDISANVSDADGSLSASTAKVYVDGKLVDSTYSNGKINISNIAVANGIHRIKFEIKDRAGNKAVAIRLVEVDSSVDASTVIVEPKDATLDKVKFGSLYWMNLKATDIETIDTVTATVDLNSSNHWELDHMELADGFTSEYTVDEDTNTATITISRTGDNTQTGEAVLASLPIRVISFADDIKYPGLNEQTYWTSTTAHFWAQDIKVDVDCGEITYVDEYEANTIGTFSNESFSVSTEMYKPYNYMTASELASQDGVHVHNAVKLEDKDATCTEEGYKNRTYCEECDSVVDWGTTIPKTGHTYVDGICKDCGNKANGWVDDAYYVNGVVVNGEVGGVLYKNGKLFNGFTYKAVANDANDYRYFKVENGVVDRDGYSGIITKGADIYKVVIDNDNEYCTLDNTYYLADGEPLTGWQQIDEEWYYFDEETGAGLDGEQTLDKGITYTFDNGRLTSGVWVTTSDGTRYWYGPDYYKDTTYDNNSCRPCEIDGKTYLFNRQGYMQTGVVFQYVGNFTTFYWNCDENGEASLLNGPYNEKFYVDGVKQNAYQLVEYDDDYYFINDGNKLAMNTKIYLSDKFIEGTDLVAGYYEFDADGKMVIKNGPVGDYFYVNGVKQSAYQLVQYKGDYYFINDGHKLAKDTKIYLSGQFIEGTDLVAGYYEFDADGKMVIKNGPVGDYFYVNGVRQSAYQLVQYEGDYYFINDGHKLAKDTKIYLSGQFIEGTDFVAGYYEFDADGKMVIKNGPVGDYFYVNGVRQSAYQLVQYEGDYYFINDGHKLAKDTKIYLSGQFIEGTDLVAGYYEFDSEGKMIIKNGPVGDYFYVNGVKQSAYQLVEYEGDYYFINDGHKIAKNITLYLSSTFVDNTNFNPGYYKFDSEGKMILN